MLLLWFFERRERKIIVILSSAVEIKAEHGWVLQGNALLILTPTPHVLYSLTQLHFFSFLLGFRLTIRPADYLSLLKAIASFTCCTTCLYAEWHEKLTHDESYDRVTKHVAYLQVWYPVREAEDMVRDKDDHNLLSNLGFVASSRIKGMLLTDKGNGN